jgi:hypothetical protein
MIAASEFPLLTDGQGEKISLKMAGGEGGVTSLEKATEQ